MLHTFLRRTVFLAAVAGAVLAPAGPARAADHAVVIMYGRFGDGPGAGGSIRVEQLDAHIRELAEGGYTPMVLDDMVARVAAAQSLPERAVAITVDEAGRSFLAEAWPRFKAAGLPVTLFVAPDLVDRGARGYLGWDDLRQLVQEGVRIGARPYSSSLRMANVPAARNTEEIQRSLERLKAELDLRPPLFAYPNGEWSLAAREAVAAAGFKAAFGQQQGAVHPRHDLLSLPRFVLNDVTGSVDRLRRALGALPLPVSEVVPADPKLITNSPPIGFTVAEGVGSLDRLSCQASNPGGPPVIERLGGGRVEIRLAQPFGHGRARLVCTLPGDRGGVRWLGMQFVVAD